MTSDHNLGTSPAARGRALAIVPAAGKGERAGTVGNKLLLPLDGVPVLLRTLESLHDCPSLDSIVVVVAPQDVTQVREMLDARRGEASPHRPLDRIAAVVPGGPTRTESVFLGMQALPPVPPGGDPGREVVVVHDGARPLVSPDVIERAVELAHIHGAAVAAWPVADTLKEADPLGRVLRTVERRSLWAIQTPQAFRRSLLAEAYDRFYQDGCAAPTDDAGLVERLGHPIQLFPGDPMNIKLTTAQDIALAEALVLHATMGADSQSRIPNSESRPSTSSGRAEPVEARMPSRVRVGIGYDAHPLRSGRALVLGGIRIENDLGLDGHSDADVLVHAICDALLGAAALGDLGKHFPDTDPRFQDISSLSLLGEVVERVHGAGFCTVNIDGVIIAEKPRLSPYIDEMRRCIAEVVRIPVDAVSIKATTTEGLGFEGAGEGIAAHAIVCIQQSAAS